MAYSPPGQTRERVYRFVRDRLLAAAPPTVREVQEAMGFAAVESARKHLDALVAEGRLAKAAGRARGYSMPRGPAPTRVQVVPVLGRVQAGDLQAATEDPDGFVAVEAGRDVGEGGLFALRVQGDSMTGAAILDGDLVVVRQQATARSGDVVVALVGDEATVKTLRLKGRRAELHPANGRYRPIVPAPGELRLLGKVIEVRRSLAP
ncbi:MAG: transcriptional repressor LexA [Planctomycetota bacterium]